MLLQASSLLAMKMRLDVEMAVFPALSSKALKEFFGIEGNKLWSADRVPGRWWPNAPISIARNSGA